MQERLETRGHGKKIFKQRADLIKENTYSFLIRVVNNWIDLPDSVVNAETVLEFERKLDEAWKDEEQKSNYTATT